MTSFDNLKKILDQELKNGCQDTLVIGGLEGFVANWRKSINNDATECEFADRLVSGFAGYHQSPTESRRALVAKSLELIEEAAPKDARTRRLPRPPAAAAPRQKKERPRANGDGRSASDAMALVGPVSETPGRAADHEDEENEGAGPILSPREVAFGLDAEVTLLQNVGPTRAGLLEKLGVTHVRDLLFLYPRRYDDYGHLKTISELMYGDEATIVARVGVVNTVQVRGKRTITNVLLVDQTGSINATFYNQRFLEKSLRPGTQVIVHGRVDRYMNRVSFSHPEWERYSKDAVGIQPIYPLTEGLTSRWLRQLARRVVKHWAGKVEDPLPAAISAREKLVDEETALREIHFPTDWPHIESARRRLAFEELMLLQMIVLRQRYLWQSQPGRAIHVEPEFGDKLFPALLPFELTGAQKRVTAEILADMQKPEPMHRLLQGDVGSGKTVVALAAMLAAFRDGHQAALMAPTEILAEQHYHGIARVLENDRFASEPRPRLGLLTGSLKAAAKEEIQQKIASGDIDLIVGTHALIQEAVSFHDLGLAVIDEQHRFGVSQRRSLQDRAGASVMPDILVMSATPIPRTLALTVFGDLDISIIDEMPKGRLPIRTKWLDPRERERAYAFIRKQVQEGRQAFVICPLIEESESIDAKAAVDEYERLQREVYPDLRVGLIHGKLRPAEKDAVMQAFAEGEIHILVATSVVEVGIDVPNATVMLVEGADRFGLAQLHQFRGRIGRGGHQSFCMLLAGKSGATSDERLKVIEESQDGFRLAEEDLKLRGPGEFFGTRQSGLPDLRIAKLSDVRLLEQARHAAQEIFRQDPELRTPEHQPLRQRLFNFWKGEGDLS